MSILDKISDKNCWLDFLEYKRSSGHFFESEEKDLAEYIDNEDYLPVAEAIALEKPFPLPLLREINKKGTDKKRRVFVFPRRENYILKLIAYLLHSYDALFAPNLYSFRRGIGVKQAVYHIVSRPGIESAYTYKVDISDYFNSVDTEAVISVLEESICDDKRLVSFISGILREPRARFEGGIVEVRKGIMAGVPFSGFLANLFLKDLDEYFFGNNILYARYSDDIIVFSRSKEQISECERKIKETLEAKMLKVNEKKEFRTSPGEKWEFLGFSVSGKEIDISEVSFEKIKAKMRRKARSLLRWKERKAASDKGAVKTFIRHFNRKMYDNPSLHDVTWALWYFPVINTSKTLKAIDEYAVSSARFIASGNHSKKSYSLRYDTLKEWGYRNLVNSFYKFKEGKPLFDDE
ncbi:MAG: hypothetical protein IJY18_03500 [Clostridia bacterium]|nr:hypothetical protein [Clostridia bacterium]